MTTLLPPVGGDDWVGVGTEALPAAEAGAWAVLPSCGAVVSFAGTSRDHSIGSDGEQRVGVTELEYEAYDEQVVPRLAAIAAEVRRRWPDVGRIGLLHRVGVVPVGESSVLVVVSAPHRGAAFEAAAFGIDAIKATAPIWKRERWSGGEAYGLDAHLVSDVAELPDLATFVGGSASTALASSTSTPPTIPASVR